MEFGLLELYAMSVALKHQLGLLKTSMSQYHEFDVELDAEFTKIKIQLEYTQTALDKVEIEIGLRETEMKEGI